MNELFEMTAVVEFVFPTQSAAEKGMSDLCKDIVMEDVTSMCHIDSTYSKPLLKFRTGIFASPHDFYTWIDDRECEFEVYKGAMKRCNFLIEKKICLDGSVILKPNDETVIEADDEGMFPSPQLFLPLTTEDEKNFAFC